MQYYISINEYSACGNIYSLITSWNLWMHSFIDSLKISKWTKQQEKIIWNIININIINIIYDKLINEVLYDYIII